MHTKITSTGKRIPLVASIVFQAFSVKALSIDEQAVRIAKATEPKKALHPSCSVYVEANFVLTTCADFVLPIVFPRRVSHSKGMAGFAGVS